MCCEAVRSAILATAWLLVFIVITLPSPVEDDPVGNWERFSFEKTIIMGQLHGLVIWKIALAGACREETDEQTDRQMDGHLAKA